MNPWTAAFQAPLSMGFSRQEWDAIAFSEKEARVDILMSYKIVFMVYLVTRSKERHCIMIKVNPPRSYGYYKHVYITEIQNK